MSYNQKDVRQFLIDILTQKDIKFEIHDFPSGCSMIDVWFEDKFYAIQSEPDSIGLSKIDADNPGFSTIPDERFFDFDKFKEKFMSLIK